VDCEGHYLVSAQRAVVDESLKSFATTPRQEEFIDAVIKHGSIQAAEAALGVAHDVVGRAIRALKRKAAMQGVSPEHDMTKGVPDVFDVKGTSTLYVADKLTGDLALRQQWVKTKLNENRAAEAIRQWVANTVESIEGRSPYIAPPAFSNADLLAVYPMGDPHFGLKALANEAGEDFNIDIAKQDIMAAMDRLVDAAPPAEVAIIAQLGDFFHSDNEQARTRRSGNSLDVDTRWHEVLTVGMDAMVYLIERALTKHRKVIVRNVRGNHDEQSSFALSLALSAWFRNNDRVEIVLSNSAFWFYEFGKVLIGLTHGDTAKPGDLPLIMAHDMAEAWGRTVYRYWYHGHIHNKQLREFPGCLVESWRTLAAKDAWHAAEGYRSGRDMTLVVMHREYGEVERHRCDIALIRPPVSELRIAA
jgi:hypothetical protein